MLDTGAGMGVVYSNTHISGMTVVGQIKSHDANGQMRAVDVVTLPPLRLGNLTVTGYQANRLGRPGRAEDADGIIGFDIFNKGLLGKIDVRHRQLILTDRKDFFKDEGGYEARYRLDFHVPYVTVSPFGRHREEVLFDTGDRSLYTISRQSFERGAEKWGGELNGQVEGRTMGSYRISHFGTEQNARVTKLCLRQLRWGDFAFCQVRALTSQGHSALGAGILDYGAVIINPLRHRLIFQPYDGEATCTVDNTLPDIYYVPQKGQPAVGLVWEDSDLYREGLRQGDVIVSIDDRPVNTFGQFMTFKYIAGHTYTYSVRDARGFMKKVTVKK
jgi:hypothetical protein